MPNKNAAILVPESTTIVHYSQFYLQDIKKPENIIMEKDSIYYSTDSINNFDMCSIKSNLSLNISNSSSTQHCCCLCLTTPSTSTNLQSCMPNSKHVNCNTLRKDTSSATIASNILSSFRRHTVSNLTETRIKTNRLRRKVGVNSFSGDLAAAADSYFYFYSLSNNSAKKCQNVSPTNALQFEIQNSSLNQKYNQKYLKSNNFYLGSNYHEFRNKFITIRLCENCQKLRNLNKVDFNSNYYFFSKKFSYNDREEDQFSQVSTIRIVDFSSNSSLLSSTLSTNLSENSYQSSFRNISPNLTQKTKKILPYQHVNNSMIDLFNKKLPDFCLPAKTILCPILTNKNFCKNKKAFNNHCCSCHNFCCCSYPDKLSYVLSYDAAVADYISVLTTNTEKKMFEKTPVTATIMQSSEPTVTTNFLQLNLNGAEAMLASCDGLNLNNKKFLSQINNLAFFRFPSLSLRLQVFNPHPNQFYCDQLISCFFCNFKRHRQPDDENLVKKTQKSILSLLNLKKLTTPATQTTTKTDSDKQLFSKKNVNKKLNEKISFNYDNPKSNNKFLHSNNLLSSINFKDIKNNFNNNNNINNNFLLNHDKKLTGFINNLNISKINKISEKKHKKLSKFNTLKVLPTLSSLKKKSLSSSSIFTLPLLTIEEKILKLLGRFCNDPEEPDVKDRCTICYIRRASVRAYPCAHQVLCRLCSVRLIKKIVETKNGGLRCILCQRQVVVLRHQKQLKKHALTISGFTTIENSTWNFMRQKSSFNIKSINKNDANLLIDKSFNEDLTQTSGAINFIFSTKIWPWNWS